MNTAILQTALYVRDLLGYDEQLIKLGRQNFKQEDFETNYIVVDQLGSIEQATVTETFDSNVEIQQLGAVFNALITLDFYGDQNAYQRAMEFALKNRSQKAYELGKQLKLSVYQNQNITDVRQLTGQQYGERMQAQFNVQYCETVDIETLRIDIAQLSILTERGYVL